MGIENRINPSENFEANKKVLEKAFVSENFSVHCDSNIKKYLKPDDAEKTDDIKKFVDDTLKTEQNRRHPKVDAYLFSNKEEYLKFLDKNFSDIPKGSATFDKQTNSVFGYSPTDVEKYKKFLGKEVLTAEKIKNIIRGCIFSEIAHEYTHLHPPFNGMGDKDKSNKWEQEMVCIFIEYKIRQRFDKKFDKNIKLQAKEYLKKIQAENKTFSWEEVSNEWDNFTAPEKFVYPWLEKKYGLKKLQDLWSKMFKNKKTISEAIKEVYNTDIQDIEKKFQEEMLSE